MLGSIGNSLSLSLNTGIMPPKSPVPLANPNKKSDEARALESYGIYKVQSYDGCPETCPPAMKSVLKLVSESQFRRISQFAAPPSEDGSKSHYDTKSGEDYDMLLKKRAEDISSICNDPSMEGAPEKTWVRKTLQPVFLVFDRSAEEKLDSDRPYHHWYATTIPFKIYAYGEEVLLVGVTFDLGVDQSSIMIRLLGHEQVLWPRGPSLSCGESLYPCLITRI